MLATIAVFATTVCCGAQAKVPPPGPLTEEYSVYGISFRYPNNWIVDDMRAYDSGTIYVAPSSAFVKNTKGHSFVTDGFSFGLVRDELLSASTDEVTTKILELAHGQGGQVPKGREGLTHVDHGSCGEMVNADTPYAGTETVMMCALRVGNDYIAIQMFSPTAEWGQYKEVFSHVLGTFSAVVVPPPGALTTEYTFPGVASFRYPNNWIVGKFGEDRVVIGPASAFFAARGHRLMTHALVIGLPVISSVPISTDELTKMLPEDSGEDVTQDTQSVEARKSLALLTDLDNGSCAKRLSSAWRHTEMMCALRAGNANIWTRMWAPAADWNQYKDVFSRILGTFSAVVGPAPDRNGANTSIGRPSIETKSGEASPLLTGREISQAAFPAMVTLIMRDKNGHSVSLGSGFFVAPRLVATNLHVVRDTTSGIAKRIGIKESLSVLGFVAVDAKNDLALLEVNDSSSAMLSIAKGSNVSIGDAIYAIGSPEGFEGTFSQGVVSGVRDRNGARLLQISAPISPGSSGGPILDQSARVVGITVATYAEGQNLNFAVPSDYLSNLLTHTSALQPLSALPAPPRHRR
jgi:S1-C subfamily serine protease